jgi:hypothetical protein
MALNPIAKPYYARPVRDYPNYNGILGIRGIFAVGLFGPSMRVDTPVVIGKVPARSMIIMTNLGCTIAVTGVTTPILDVGTRDPVTGVVTRQALAAAFDMSAPGVGQGTGMYCPEETEIVMTLGGTGTLPTAGGGNAIVTFATKAD